MLKYQIFADMAKSVKTATKDLYFKIKVVDTDQDFVLKFQHAEKYFTAYVVANNQLIKTSPTTNNIKMLENWVDAAKIKLAYRYGY